MVEVEWNQTRNQPNSLNKTIHHLCQILPLTHKGSVVRGWRKPTYEASMHASASIVPAVLMDKTSNVSPLYVTNLGKGPRTIYICNLIRVFHYLSLFHWAKNQWQSQVSTSFFIWHLAAQGEINKKEETDVRAFRRPNCGKKISLLRKRNKKHTSRSGDRVHLVLSEGLG